jgi:hypothetical protein
MKDLVAGPSLVALTRLLLCLAPQIAGRALVRDRAQLITQGLIRAL